MFFFGGIAENAVLDGRLTRPHQDVVYALALYQLRSAFVVTGTFGELRPTDVAAQERLRATVFAGADAATLVPHVEPLPVA